MDLSELVKKVEKLGKENQLGIKEMNKQILKENKSEIEGMEKQILKEIEKRGTAIIKTEIELNKKGEPQLKKSIIPFDDFYIKPKTDLEKLEAATKILDRSFSEIKNDLEEG